MDIRSLRFFKESSLAPKDPAEFKELVEPLALLSAARQHYVYYDDASDEIDDALVAFENLLTTVTKMVSDLLKLMPRTTPLDRAMWDIVMKEMVKAGFISSNYILKDWAAAIRAEDHPELETKIEWLEVNCMPLVSFRVSTMLISVITVAELERYHNDINQASITEFLGANDRGRGCTPYLPRVGNTCERYKATGTYMRGGEELVMSVVELEAELAAARKEMRTVSDELHEVMRSNGRLVAELG
jgi:hypothetical protein